MRKLIRASAGSGKTYQLSGHFLRQLFEGHPPESILATTFTRKAAGEILGRVLLRLADAASDPKAAKQLAAALAPVKVTRESAASVLTAITSQLHRLRVCTLDSFFQQVARSLTLELGLPPGWTIIDEHLAADLKTQAIDAVLAEQVHREAVELMLMLAKGKHKRSIRTLIDDTVSKCHELYLHTDESAWHPFPERKRISQARLDQSVEALRSVAATEETPFAKPIVQDVDRFVGNDWDAFLGAGLAIKVLNGDETFSRKTIPEHLIAAYQPLVDHAREEILDRFRRQLMGIRSLMDRFDAEYSRLLSEHGWQRFSDVTRTLAQSGPASDGGRIQFRLDSTIRNLLLDEFQDTSPDQWRVLQRLTATLDQHAESSFFCVGDGKQAIYGWRGGEAEILDAVESSIADLELQPLDQSRRSSRVVIDAVNRVFTHIDRHSNLSDKADGVTSFVARFPEHSTAMDQMPGYVCLRTGPAADATVADDGDETATAAPEDSENPDVGRDWFTWVAAQIRDLHQRCPAAEIGVLTRRKNSVARLVHELTLLGVVASEEGGTLPTDSPVALAIMSLLSFAANPSCTVSRFHVCSTPLGSLIGMTDWKDDATATKVAEGIRAALVDHGYGRMLQTWSDAVRSHCSERDWVRLQQIIGEGWKFDAEGSLNPAAFVSLLEQTRFERSRPAPVRVMTIHQSKGLEFDTVVLPELDMRLIQTPSFATGSSAPGSPPNRVCVWVGQKQRGILPSDLRGIFDETIRRNVTESLCVLYVALTRAKHSLHLFIKPIKQAKLPASYAGLLVAALTESDQAPPSTLLWQDGDPDWFQSVPSLTSAKAMKPVPESTVRVRLASMPHGRRRGLARRTPSKHDQTRLFLPAVNPSIRPKANRNSQARSTQTEIDPRLRGIVMHAWFECVAWLDEANREPDDTTLRRRAAKLTIPTAVVDALLPEFRALLKQPVVGEVFDRSRQRPRVTSNVLPESVELRLERERSFLWIDGGELIQGTIDRLVIFHIAGTPVAADIIDFKTDRLVGPVQEWITQKQHEYAAQLADYRAAVTHCLGVPAEHVRSRLMLVEAAAVVEA